MLHAAGIDKAVFIHDVQLQMLDIDKTVLNGTLTACRCDCVLFNGDAQLLQQPAGRLDD